MSREPRTLGVYSDGPLALVETADGERIAPDAADFPFLTFVCTVGLEFEATLLFGRVHGRVEANGRPLLPPSIVVEPLPFYESLLDVGQLVRAAPGTLRAFWRGLSNVDAVWVFGPHPFAFLLVAAAAVRRRRVVLGVRQDTLAYFRGRLPGARWKPALLAVRLWDVGFRCLGRCLSTTAVGDKLSQAYGEGRAGLLTMTVSLVRDADLVPAPPARDWTGTIELLTVGRIDREKNPLLLVDALAALRRQRPGRYRLVWVGTGPLEAAVRRRAEELGVGDVIEFAGFVPFGPELLERYRKAHLFVHVSLTEGVPAVLIEALASGTPVVATDVGGVAAMLDGGRLGLLVPPADLDALVAALVQAIEDAGGRDLRVREGLEAARAWTLDKQAERIARFIKGSAAENPIEQATGEATT